MRLAPTRVAVAMNVLVGSVWNQVKKAAMKIDDAIDSRLMYIHRRSRRGSRASRYRLSTCGDDERRMDDLDRRCKTR